MAKGKKRIGFAVSFWLGIVVIIIGIGMYLTNTQTTGVLGGKYGQSEKTLSGPQVISIGLIYLVVRFIMIVLIRDKK